MEVFTAREKAAVDRKGSIAIIKDSDVHFDTNVIPGMNDQSMKKANTNPTSSLLRYQSPLQNLPGCKLCIHNLGGLVNGLSQNISIQPAYHS